MARTHDGVAAAGPGGGGPPTALFCCSLSGTVLTVGAALAELSGRSVGEVSGLPAQELLHSSSHAALRHVLRVARGGAASGSATFRFRHADGSGVEVPTSWSALAGSDADERQVVFVRAGTPDAAAPPVAQEAVPDAVPDAPATQVADLTYGPRLGQRPGTGLQDGPALPPDRRQVLDRLTDALGRAEHATAVLVVDLDHFRVVNASRGHDIGDRVLAGVGARLRAAVSGRQAVARCGDDEFAVVCEDTDAHQALALARWLLGVVAEPFFVDDVAVQVTASIGVAVAPARPAVAATELLRHADTAVLAGKTAGRGRVHLFEETLDEDVERRYALATDLRAALADEAVHLEYMPIVDLRSGAVVGMEALTRWTHPEHGPVPPSCFVAAAELSGLAPDLDRWVLHRALQEVVGLRRAGALPADAYVAVNLSAASLTDASVLDDVVTWTEEYGLPASLLVLEITETAIMQNTDVAVELLRRLRERGVRVAMDDFGTGYSSLAYLRDLPISALKIDRSFVADIAEQQDALAIVAWIVDLARAVGVDVVAEGVETAEQLALLQGLGCTTAQGWLWGQAVPVASLSGGRQWTSPPAPDRDPARTPGKRVPSVSHGLTRLLQLHRTGATVPAIAAALNAEGLRTPAGAPWHRSNVARVIAHRIRRCAGSPEAAPGARLLARRGEPATRPR